MRIQRAGVSRRFGPQCLPCGCLVLVVLGALVGITAAVLIALPKMPDLAAQAMGFTPRGRVDAVFAATQVPMPIVQNAQTVDQVAFNVEGHGQEILRDQPQLYDFTLGTVADQQTMTATFTEAGLLDLCRARTTLCNNSNPQIQNVSVDLRPGGMVVYADAVLPQLGGISQRLGAVLTLDESARRLVFAGLAINDGLFTNPSTEMNVLVGQIQTGANDILTTLTAQVGGSSYTLSRITIDDNAVTLFLQ